MEPIQCIMKKNVLGVPLGLSFHSMASFNLNYQKSAKCSRTFRLDKLFSILAKYRQVGKYTVIISEYSVPKKEKGFLSFGWQIYVMVKPRSLQNYGKLYI